MLRRAFVVAFVVGMAMDSHCQEARAAGPWAAPLQPILEALDKAKLSGSLEFSGRCEPGTVPDFPRFRAPATSGGSPLQTLREILADDPAMQVVQGSDGMTRMIENDIATDLLNVKISHISFENNGVPLQYGAYNPNGALLFVIFQAPEVVAFMKAHDIEWPGGGGIGGDLHRQWTPDKPHISGAMENLTVSEALDRVLKTFPGMWIYENCPGSGEKKREVYFRFLSIEKIATECSLLVVDSRSAWQ